MTTEAGLIPFGHESYDGELFIKEADVLEAIRKARLLIGIERPDAAARNIVLSMADRRGEAHALMLGGAAISPDAVTFWSSPYTEHAGLVRDGKRGCILISHTHEPNTSFRMKEMDITEIPPEQAAIHLAELNAAREAHYLRTRPLAEFTDRTAPKNLYVATPSPDPDMSTVPVSAYVQDAGELIWMRSVSYPVSLAEVFDQNVNNV